MTINFDASAERLQGQLREGERLIWSGGPDPRVFVNGNDRLIWPLAITLIAFTAVNFTMSSFDTAQLISPENIALLGLALYASIGRLFVRRRRKAKLCYGITNERALILNDADNLRYIDLKNTVHDIREESNGSVISVAFRVPNSSASGRTGFIDLYLEGVPVFILSKLRGNVIINGMGGASSVNPSSFVFLDVSDSISLLSALRAAPSAN